MIDALETVEAFADGERVDAGGLTRALADPRGRQHFVDVLVLRGMFADHHATAELEIVRGGGRAGGAQPLPASAMSSRFVAIAAAAGLVLSLGTGFAVGWGVAARAAGSNPAPGGRIAQPLQPITAPAPTQVIRFEPGVDWRDGAGGN